MIEILQRGPIRIRKRECRSAGSNPAGDAGPEITKGLGAFL